MLALVAALLCVQSAAASHIVRRTPTWPGFDKITHWFVFGDSYSATNFDFNGVQPSADNPLGNPAYPGTTTSNGPNYVDYLTTTYNKSLLLTYNLAFGGATIDNSIVPAYSPDVPSGTYQVDNDFQKYLQNVTTVNWTATNTLFSFWFGVNDVGSYNDANASAILQADIAQYKRLIETVYSYGARNILVLNVPPVDRTPNYLTLNSSSNATLLNEIHTYNAALTSMMENLHTEHQDATFILYDAHDVFTRALNNVSSYTQTSNIKNATGYCDAYVNGTPEPDTFYSSCSYPADEYFWLNFLHPTSPVHAALASDMARLLSSSNPAASSTATGVAIPSRTSTTRTATVTSKTTTSASAAAATVHSTSSASRPLSFVNAYICGLSLVLLWLSACS